MKTRKRLTDLVVGNMKAPTEGHVDLYDTGMDGLMLRMNHGGRKTWQVRFYLPGIAKSGKKKGRPIQIPTTKRVGIFPQMGVKAAREAANKFLANPPGTSGQAIGTFGEVAENFIKLYVDQDRESDRKIPLRSKPEIVRCLRKYTYPAWENRPLADIRRKDVTALIDGIAANNGFRQANLVLAIVRKLMNWQEGRDDDYICPIARGKTKGARKRDRTLDDDEIRALWQACDALPHQGRGALVKLLLLTAQRRDKVCTMKWSDIKDGVWTIAKEDREKSNAGSLVLPPLALDILRNVPRMLGNPYVFTSRGNGHFDRFSTLKLEIDRRLPADMPHWTFHDLRRTARSLLPKAGITPHVAERVLGHSIRGVEGIYDHHSYQDEKAAALQALANLVERIVGDNVVPMRPAANSPVAATS
jgi:integrase